MLLGLTALASCGAPSPSPTHTAAAGTNDASVVVRLSGREINLRGGNCTWFEEAGELVVDFAPSAAGDSVRLRAPLAWSGVDVPAALPSSGALEVTLAGQPLRISGPSLIGELASDAGSGSFGAQTVDGAPVTGEFTCPTVIDGD